jgi:hypothetical protein
LRGKKGSNGTPLKHAECSFRPTRFHTDTPGCSMLVPLADVMPSRLLGKGAPQPASIRCCLRNFRAPFAAEAPPQPCRTPGLLGIIFLNSHSRKPYKGPRRGSVVIAQVETIRSPPVGPSGAAISFLQPPPQNYAGAFKSQVPPA